jgi:subtilase family serine protease
VTETTANQGGAAPASTTAFYLSTDSTWDGADVMIGSRAVPALAAGTSSSASTSVTIPSGTPAGSYYLLARADAASGVAESVETNNVNARALQVGADLVVSALTVPSSGGAGAPLTVTDSTANTGSGAAGASVTGFYLSTDILVDAGDVFLGSRLVPALAPGTVSSASTSLTIPAGTATGTYYVLARADVGGVVAESQEGNNVFARAVQIGADLAVTAFSAPAIAGGGVAFTVTDTTLNRGGGAAPASSTGYYLSIDSTWDAGDALVGSRSVPALAAGASSSGSASVTVSVGTPPGTYYLIARADATEAIAESQEANNSSARVVQVGPDLWVPALTAPAAAGAGAPFTVTDTTANQGGGAGDASTTAFYLSTNATWDAGDVLLGRREVPALAAGASSRTSTSLTLPADTLAGTYYILARADAGQAVAESVEGNNVGAVLMQVGADLKVLALTVPAGVGAGVPFSVTDTTTNAGAGDAGTSTTSYYLSANTVLDAGDVLLGSRAVGGLAPGASDSGSVTLTLPAGTAAGSYYVIARADDGQVVTESQETNNTLARAVQVGPDLAVTALSVAASIGTDAPFTVTDTTANQSGSPAGASTTSYYLSANAFFDASDVLLGSRAVPALAGGASDTASVALTLPAGTAPGYYYVLARADAAATVIEGQEGNNVTGRQVSVGPDLALSRFDIQPTLKVGVAFTVTDTTVNQGGAAAGASTTSYYLSVNYSLDGSDLMLGGRAIPALAPGSADTGTASLTVPAGTAPGTYYVIARTDATGAVGEFQEFNNVLVRVVTVSP